MVEKTALVDFYKKWGRVEDAQHVFKKMPHKNVILWNALISRIEIMVEELRQLGCFSGQIMNK